MKYRDAKHLDTGDQIRRKSDGEILVVKNKILYGQFKEVLFECINASGAFVHCSNTEVELNGHTY